VLPASALQDYVAVHAALAYAQAVVAYLADLRRDDPAEAARQGTVLGNYSGRHVGGVEG
jgi:hypothetical protein